jgi:uncharacterized protein (TIGR03435 family)
MKRDEMSTEKILRQLLPRPSQEPMESNCIRVLENLRANAEFAADEDFVNSLPRSDFRWLRFGLVAAAVVLMAILIGAVSWRHPDFAVIESNGLTLRTGEPLRTTLASTTLKLPDGSRIEVRAQSELVLMRSDDGWRIHLRQGGIIVSAAKQRDGHLYVQTKDVTVSVVGTVFLVNAEEEGSRVAVIQGEVRVQEPGFSEKKLGPGEQAATNPKMEPVPVKAEIAWSLHAGEHMALLQQSVVAPVKGIDAFDVYSVRPSGSGGGVGRGGSQGSYSIDEKGCGGLLPIQIDPARFAVFGVPLHTLVTWAYGTGEIHYKSCIDMSALNIVSGGPGWSRSEPWDVQASIPVYALDEYSADQWKRGDVPRFRKMLRALLADRFKLVVRPERKEVRAYVLTADNGAPRFIVPDIYAGGAEDPTFKKYVWDEKPTGARPSDLGIVAKDAFLSEIIPILSRAAGRPVVDQTGITNKVNLILYYDWAPNPSRPLSAPPLSKALEQVGFRFTETKTTIETWLIESAEKPSEN